MLCSNLMIVQRDGRPFTLEIGRALYQGGKSVAANKVTSKYRKWCQMLLSLGKKKNNRSNRSYIPGPFSDQITLVTDEPVVQCDVPAVKNNFVDDGDTNDVNRF